MCGKGNLEAEVICLLSHLNSRKKGKKEKKVMKVSKNNEDININSIKMMVEGSGWWKI